MMFHPDGFLLHYKKALHDQNLDTKPNVNTVSTFRTIFNEINNDNLKYILEYFLRELYLF